LRATSHPGSARRGTGYRLPGRNHGRITTPLPKASRSTPSSCANKWSNVPSSMTG